MRVGREKITDRPPPSRIDLLELQPLPHPGILRHLDDQIRDAEGLALRLRLVSPPPGRDQGLPEPLTTAGMARVGHNPQSSPFKPHCQTILTRKNLKKADF